MPTFDYARSAATAIRLIAKFGMTGATLRRPTSGTGGDQWNPTGDFFTDYPCSVALIDYSEREINGTTILVKDRKAFIAPDIAVEPAADDFLIVGSDTYSVVIANAVKPGGIAVLYQLQVRR